MLFSVKHGQVSPLCPRASHLILTISNEMARKLTPAFSSIVSNMQPIELCLYHYCISIELQTRPRDCKPLWYHAALLRAYFHSTGPRTQSATLLCIGLICYRSKWTIKPYLKFREYNIWFDINIGVQLWKHDMNITIWHIDFVNEHNNKTYQVC